jgi:hypothetical protein
MHESKFIRRNVFPDVGIIRLAWKASNDMTCHSILKMSWYHKPTRPWTFPAIYPVCSSTRWKVGTWKPNLQLIYSLHLDNSCWLQPTSYTELLRLADPISLCPRLPALCPFVFGLLNLLTAWFGNGFLRSSLDSRGFMVFFSVGRRMHWNISCSSCHNSTYYWSPVRS